MGMRLRFNTCVAIFLTTAGACSQITPASDSVGRELSSVSAEIVGSNVQAEWELKLVARLEIQPNEILEFYEPLPGMLLLSAAGAPTVPTAVAADQGGQNDPAQIWARYANGAPMPDALADALARRAARLAQMPPPGVEPPNEPPGVGTSSLPQDVPRPVPSDSKTVDAPAQALSGPWCNTTWYSFFDANYEFVLGRCLDWDYDVCWDEVSGNGGWASHNDVQRLASNVCPYVGNVTLKLSGEAGGNGSWTVKVNTYRWVVFNDIYCDAIWPFDDCPTIRIDIENASGDSFNFRYHVYDS